MAFDLRNLTPEQKRLALGAGVVGLGGGIGYLAYRYIFGKKKAPAAQAPTGDMGGLLTGGGYYPTDGGGGVVQPPIQCPPGYHFDEIAQACVPDTVTPPQPPPSPPPTDGGGGFTGGGITGVGETTQPVTKPVTPTYPTVEETAGVLTPLAGETRGPLYSLWGPQYAGKPYVPSRAGPIPQQVYQAGQQRYPWATNIYGQLALLGRAITTFEPLPTARAAPILPTVASYFGPQYTAIPQAPPVPITPPGKYIQPTAVIV